MKFNSMTTNIQISSVVNDENEKSTRDHHHLSPPSFDDSTIVFKAFPRSILHRLQREDQSSIETTDDEETTTTSSESKTLKHLPPDNLRRTLLEHRFSRRIHSSFSSSSTLRISTRRRSMQQLSSRSARRQTISLARTSKWFFIRTHLHQIAMMNERYARMKIIERDLRWVNLREQICKQVLEMRDMSLLRQEDDGLVKKRQKTSFDLKTIPDDEVVHVERDGRVYSMSTRDLVLGRLINASDIQLDTLAQLDARRRFRVKQNLLKQQQGRTRLKKHIAFSFCLCNLSFIVLMFISMFVFAMKTVFELKSLELF